MSSKEIFEQEDWRFALRELLEVPLEFKYYHVCFENNIHIIGFEEEYVNTNLNLSFNNGSFYEILVKSIKCFLHNVDNDFSYEWSFVDSDKISFDNKTSKKEFNFLVSNVKSYARSEINGVLIKNFLLIFIWLTVIILVEDVRKFVK